MLQIMFEAFNWFSFIRTSSKQVIVAILFILVGLLCLMVGVGWLFFSNNRLQATCFQAEGDSLATTINQSIVIDISGAVVKPGTYKLDKNSRIVDAVRLAQGFTHQSNATYIYKSLNLAAKLSDGQKIYIPFEGEQITSDSDLKTISINSATIEELTQLSGIGEKRAETIMANRPYQTINELVEKSIVSQSVFDEISELLSL